MRPSRGCYKRGAFPTAASSAALLIAFAISACTQDQGSFTTELVNTDEAMTSKTATMLKVAGAAQASGDSTNATAVYQQVVKEHPELPKAKTALAQNVLARGDATLALRYFDEARKLDPNNIDNFVGAGQAHVARHEPRLAQKDFKAALDIDPANAKAINGMGVALDATESHEQAQTYYRKALKLDPGDQAIRNNLGLSLALSGRHEEAVAELAPLTEVEGEIGRKARQNLSLSFAMRGDFVNASRWAQVDQKVEEIRNDLRVYGSTGVK